jgi:phosphoribosylglycinamide formyltransferase-1
MCAVATATSSLADTPGAPLGLAVIISGRGSNMLAIARACQSGAVNARVLRVIADRDSAAGIAAAQALGLATRVIPARSYPDKPAFEVALADEIDASGASLVVLAGFMRILSPQFTARYEGRMLNIHPSLLPAYKGLHTHERVLAAGETIHGVTVHYVTAELDGGPLVLQARIAIAPGDTADTLSARVQQREHIIYPRVIGWIASGRLQWRDDGPWLDGKALQQPVLLAENAT